MVGKMNWLGLVLLAASAQGADRVVVMHQCSGSDGKYHTIVEDLYRHARTGQLTSAYIKHAPTVRWDDQRHVDGEGFVEKSPVQTTGNATTYGYRSIVSLPDITITYPNGSSVGSGTVWLQDGLTDLVTHQAKKKRISVKCRLSRYTLKSNS